jgi:hypothetical protein
MNFRYLCQPIKMRFNDGGAKRDRTADLLRARQALSQLSYSPILVGLGRFELPTSPLSGVRSNQLSYRPGHFAAKVSCIRFIHVGTYG